MKFAFVSNRASRCAQITFYLVVLTQSLFAATYYIDYSAGSDTNNGTSTNTAWKLAPGMTGFSGSYSHAVGDTFVFKGGIIWSNAALPLHITAGGNATTNDVYTSDTNWYSGGSWTRPIFDAQFIDLAGTYHSPVFVEASYLAFRNIEVKNMLIPNSAGWDCYGVASVMVNIRTNVTIQNCYVHDWKPGSTNETGYAGGIFFYNSPGGVAIQNTVGPSLPPTGTTGTSGVGIFAASAYSNILTGISQPINGCSTVAFNTISNCPDSYVPNAHCNAVFLQVSWNNAVVNIHDNIIHNLGSTFQTFFVVVGASGATNGTFKLYNNIGWSLSAPGIALDNSGVTQTNNGVTCYVFNNTFAVDSCLGLGSRPGTPFIETVFAENNHWISDTYTGNPIINPNNAYNRTYTNNIQTYYTNAIAAGYTPANAFAPTSVSSLTVGAGTNLTSLGFFTTDIRGNTRPATGAWDVGAYQFRPVLGSMIPPSSLRVLVLR